MEIIKLNKLNQGEIGYNNKSDKDNNNNNLTFV